VARIVGAGELEVDGGLAATVTFAAGKTGELILGDSAAFTGAVAGLSKTGANSLDLEDIDFGETTTATFSGSTKSGVLTVTDGTHTATITLIGNYTTSTFTAASDGHGGTIVTDPTAPAAKPPSLPLVTAMAGFGAAQAGGSTRMSDFGKTDMIMFASPRTATS
jgi:hypothetical protein